MANKEKELTPEQTAINRRELQSMKYLYKNWLQLPWAPLPEGPAEAAIPKPHIRRMPWYTSGFT